MHNAYSSVRANGTEGGNPRRNRWREYGIQQRVPLSSAVWPLPKSSQKCARIWLAYTLDYRRSLTFVTQMPATYAGRCISCERDAPSDFPSFYLLYTDITRHKKYLDIICFFKPIRRQNLFTITMAKNTFSYIMPSRFVL